MLASIHCKQTQPSVFAPFLLLLITVLPGCREVENDPAEPAPARVEATSLARPTPPQAKPMTPPKPATSVPPTGTAAVPPASNTALHDAAGKGNVVAVKKLLDAGTDINARDADERTPLHRAAVEGKLDVVKLLIERGADVTARDFNQRTVLDALGEVMKRHWDAGEEIPADLMTTAQMLADKLSGGPKARTMHRYAFAYGAEEAEEQLKNGADINAHDPEYMGETALHMSAFAGVVDRMELFIRYGADVNARDDSGTTPLLAAARSGEKAAVALLLEKGADARAVDRAGETALHALAGPLSNRAMEEMDIGHGRIITSDYPATAELLIQHGVDANARNHDGETALHQAAEGGWRDVMDVLIAHGGDIHIKDKYGRTPYGSAVRILSIQEQQETRRGRGNLMPSELKKLDRFRAFVKELGERYSAESRAADVVAAAAYQKMRDDECAEFNRRAEETPPPVATEPNSGRPGRPKPSNSGLLDARDVATAEKLLAAGADINARDRFGRSPLHNAAQGGRTELVRFLLSHGARPDALGHRNGTPLHEAAENGRPGAVALLLAKGANPNASSSSRYTPLHSLIAGRLFSAMGDEPPEPGQQAPDFLKTAALLLDQGASVEAKDEGGKTPLYTAAAHGYADIVGLLIDRGAKISGSGALSAAASGRSLWMDDIPDRFPQAQKLADYRATVELLIAHGADVNETDEMKYTPLHMAAIFGDVDVAQILLAHGANVDAVARLNETPLKGALRGQQNLESTKDMMSANELADRRARVEKVIALLREKGAKE